MYGIELLPHGKRRTSLRTGAETMFVRVFAGHILSFDEEAARAFSSISAARRQQGRPIAEFDAQIASIARSRDATLATRNTGDFEGCGVRLVNPWHPGLIEKNHTLQSSSFRPSEATEEPAGL